MRGNVNPMNRARSCSILFVWAALALPSMGTTRYVSPPPAAPEEDGSEAFPFDTIQEALDAAAPDDDVIVQPGTYSGAGNFDLNFQGKAVLLRAAEGPSNTVIDVQNLGRAFNISSGETTNTIIRGFRVTGVGTQVSATGGEQGSPAYAEFYGPVGSAVFCASNSGVTIDACWFEDNKAQTSLAVTIVGWIGDPYYNEHREADGSGGAVWSENSDVVITGSRFSGNGAGLFGGAIYAHGGSLRIEDSAFEGNSAGLSNDYVQITVGSPGDTFYEQNRIWNLSGAGGAVAAIGCGEVSLQNCQWEGNFSTGPGGAFYSVSNDSVQIVGNTSVVNAAYVSGGAFHLSDSPGDVQLLGNVICSNQVTYGLTNVSTVLTIQTPADPYYQVAIGQPNSGADGGGVFVSGCSTVRVEQCELTGNSVVGRGGGLYSMNSGFVVITDSLFRANSARVSGGGLHVEAAQELALLDLDVNGNSTGDGGSNITSVITIGDVGDPYYEQWIERAVYGIGGGVAVAACATVLLENVACGGNAVTGRGGGFYLVGNGPVSGNSVYCLTNAAEIAGGGLYVAGSEFSLSISNVEFRANTASPGKEHGEAQLTVGGYLDSFYQFVRLPYWSGSGGGLVIDGATALFSQALFTSNTAAYGGAVSVTGGMCIATVWQTMGNRADRSRADTLTQLRYADFVDQTSEQNDQSGPGAVIYLVSGTAMFDRVSMTANRGGAQGAIVYAGDGALLGATNLLVADNLSSFFSSTRSVSNEVSNEFSTGLPIYGVQGESIVHLEPNSSAMLVHATVAQNRLNVTSAPIRVASGFLELVNSIVWSNGIYADNPTNVVIRYSCVEGQTGEMVLILNPLVSPEGRLASASPCRDAGDAAVGVTVDLDGESRTLPDMGSDEFVDADSDGMADFWELAQFGTLASNALDDADNDSVANVSEYEAGTGVFDSDSDDDEIPDGWELVAGLDPRWYSAGEDPDADEYLNVDEYVTDTDPLDPASYLRFESLAPDSAVISWWGATGRAYAVESSTNEVQWEGVAELAGQGAPLNFTNTLPAASSWLRLRARLAE